MLVVVSAPAGAIHTNGDVAPHGRANGSNGTATGAIFVLPSTVTTGLRGPVASWVSTAGWARAAHRVLGRSWLATPRGVIEPDDAQRQASDPRLTGRTAATWRSHMPVMAKRAVKDVRELLRARRFRVDRDGPWRDTEVRFVWQRHELFHTAGLDLARELDVPSVLFVPATLVWESTQWGVRRPGWGYLVEHFGELPALRGADVVAAGSDMVADEIVRAGVKHERIIVTPSGVDIDDFVVHTDPGTIREWHGLEDRFVVGWVGSFRRFHSVEQLVEAATRIDNVSLLLVGDGPERPRVEQLARDRGVHAVFTGTVRYKYVASYLAAMDVGVVLAPEEGAFHYSPLKLAEYVAAGLPVVAPRVAQVAARLRDGADSVLVPVNDPGQLADGLLALRDDPERRRRIAANARAAAETQWTWDNEVRRILAALD